MIESNLVVSIFSQLSKRMKKYFQYFWSLLINMEHNLYDNDIDDFYDDDSDTLIMDLSDICDKSDDSEEETESKSDLHCWGVYIHLLSLGI